MSDYSADSSGNTEQFRAFAQRDTEESADRSRMLLIAGGVAVAVVVLGVVLAFLV
jgi:hypothetical protein